MPADTLAPSPFLLTEASVDRVDALTPSFVRVWFRGAQLGEFGHPGRSFDQRIKIVMPEPGREVPDISQIGADDADWYGAWKSLPEEERGSMRTYTIRDIAGSGADTLVAVDFVLHLEPGLSGPASRWAARAQPGDRVLLVGPRRGHNGGGVEYTPGDASRVVLVGDETALPAIERILLDTPPTTCGRAIVEVPSAADVRRIHAPAGVEVSWVVRDGVGGAGSGDTVLADSAIAAILGDATAASASGEAEAVGDTASEGESAGESGEDETLIWETPVYSGAGEQLDTSPDAAPGAHGIPGLYVWIAGESSLVTSLRRRLVRDHGLERHQVAFMGYWRRGVAMRA